MRKAADDYKRVAEVRLLTMDDTQPYHPIDQRVDTILYAPDSMIILVPILRVGDSIRVSHPEPSLITIRNLSKLLNFA